MQRQEIPLPTGFKSIAEFPRLKENLHNFINIGGNRIVSRAGVSSVANTGQGPCRGQAKFKNELYQISGTKLIRITSAYVVNDISTSVGLDISGSAECETAAGYTYLVIVAKGGRGYAYNESGTLVEISDPDYVDSIDVCYINGKWVFIPADGGPAFVSDPLDPTTIPATGFFDAEFQPDLNKGCENIRNRLYIFGEDTIEVFRDTGTGAQPFVRVEGAAIPAGLVAGKTRHTFEGGNETVVFLGKDQDQAFGIYAVGSGAAPKISNEAVDELLNDEYTLAELETCIAQRLNWNKKDIAVFRLPRHTLCFCEGEWTFFTTVASPAEKLLLGQDFKAWRVKYITHCYGEYYTGDDTTDDVGLLSKNTNSDYGEDIDYRIFTFFSMARGSYFTVCSAELDGLAGQITPEATIGLSMSDDGFVYGPRVYIGMGDIGVRERRVCWELMGGLGDYENFAGFQFQTTAAVELAQKSFSIVYQ